MASKIIGYGGYLPDKIVTNHDLEKLINTSEEWIRSRTGITKRHIAAPEEFSSHMAFAAAKAAIFNAQIDKNEIDLVVVCTNTPDNTFPSTANKLHGMLGLKDVPSFDLQAICSGFIYGMHVTDSLLKSGAYKTALLVCVDKMSSILDWQDRKTCVLFGDGAGAVILRRDDTANVGITDSKIYSDGSLFDILYTTGGVSSTGNAGIVHMKGPEVFKKAIEKMSESISDILVRNNLSINDIDFVVPHQANIRILDAVATKLNVDDSKVIKTVTEHANCSAGSIPLALARMNDKGMIKPGKTMVCASFGAGATWGALLYKW